MRPWDWTGTAATVALTTVMTCAGVACGGGGSSGPPGEADAASDHSQNAPRDGSPADGSTPPETSTPDGSDAGVKDAQSTQESSTGQDSSTGFVTAAHPAWPLLVDNAGVVLTGMTLVTVVSEGDPDAPNYFAFGDTLIASKWWQSFATEYGLGTPVASVHVTGGPITADPNAAAMQTYIAASVAATPDAGITGPTMFMLYLPKGINIQDDATNTPNTNCRYYGGYHEAYGNTGNGWGVVQHCPIVELPDIQQMTVFASHEIVEGATDPVPNNGWTLVPSINHLAPWTQSPWAIALYGEVGDMCSFTKTIESGFVFQRMWSNIAAAKELDPCVPPYAQYAYENTSVPQGWYTVLAGSTVDIPVTGWSDRATGNWYIEPYIAHSMPTTGFTVSLNSPTALVTDAGSYPTINNGETATLKITAPSTAPSGSWAVVEIYSYTSTTTGDQDHVLLVGAYVK